MTIARYLWPTLRLTSEGGAQDRAGIDGGIDFGKGLEPVQIKFDTRIAETHRVYHEIYEKTKGSTNQLWRPSPHAATWFLFTTVGYAWRVHVDVLADMEVDRVLEQINPTSRGFLIPEGEFELRDCERLEHSL